MFDGTGFKRSLDRVGVGCVNRRALIIGAGGAASALATVLAAAGVAEIGLYDPDRSKAERLAELVQHAFGISTSSLTESDPAGFDLIINASPLGLNSSAHCQSMSRQLHTMRLCTTS